MRLATTPPRRSTTFVLAVAVLFSVACGDDDVSMGPDAALPDVGPAVDGGYPRLTDLDTQIAAAMQTNSVPGLAACIIKDGAVQWCGAYGWADIDGARPVRLDTPFLLASVSKLMAGATVMHAWENDVIDLDAPVSVPFTLEHPAFPMVPITARMLLTHQSGIIDNWDIMETLYAPGDSAVGLADFMRSYLVPGEVYFDASLNFLATGPGGGLEYSNVAMSLSAYALEAHIASDFASYSQENVFGPLELENTSWFLAGLDADDVALPYEMFGGEFETEGHYSFPDYPSGLLRSSAPDVARFFAMLMNGGAIDGVRILEESTVEEMRRLQRPGDEEQGIVWFYSTVDGEQLLGHDGSEFGCRTEIQFRTRDNVGVVVLMNAESDPAIATVMRDMFIASADL